MSKPDMLRMDYINGLPQPFIAKFFGGSEWPVYDICVETGLIRIDVCGKLDIKHIGDVKEFVDMDGIAHNADTFYTFEDEPELLDAGVWVPGEGERT